MAKPTLQDLSVKKLLNDLGDALDGAIQEVTVRVLEPSRIEGLDSLPDEILARIFEFSYEGPDFDNLNLKRTLNVLASVCSRFRRVALHLPELWEVVSSFFGSKHVELLKSRCQKPVVHIYVGVEELEYGADKSIQDFLQALHPSDQWRELVIESDYADDEVYDIIFRPVSVGSLSKLECLTIKAFTVYEDDVSLSRSRLKALANWDLPALHTLKLVNVLPQQINCPNLRNLNIELDVEANIRDFFNWDFRMLKRTLARLRSIQSLSLILSSVVVHDVEVGDDPVELLHLRSLSLKIDVCPEALPIKKLAAIIDMPNLVKLKFELNDDDSWMPAKWVEAFFEHNRRLVTGHTNVEEVAVDVNEKRSNFEGYITIRNNVSGAPQNTEAVDDLT